MNVNVVWRIWIAVLLAGAQFVPGEVAARQHFPAAEDLQTMLRYLVEDGETKGIVVGVLEADGSTRVVSYGSAGPGARPLGPRSVFEIGSITKTFTGTLLAELVARGDVALDDPVSKHLPNGVTVPARGGREITLLDLATHTSGIEDAAVIELMTKRGLAPADPQDPWADYTIDGMYAWLSVLELGREPGTEYSYSNLGMGLLGHALARSAGTPLRELVRQRILDPLDMRTTGYALAGELEPWMVRGHGSGDVVPYWFATEAAEGAGGLRSNAEDMLTFLAANIGPPETELERAMHAAQQPRRPAGEGDSRIGLAWRSYTLNGRPLVWHGGATGGFRAVLVFDPERRVGVVVLANSEGFGDNIGTDLVVHDPPPAIPEVAVSPAALNLLAGEYAAGVGMRLYVRADEEGHLTAQAPSEARVRLYAESDTVFFAKREEWRLTFRRHETGGAASLILAVRGREQRLARVGDRMPEPAVVAGNAIPPVSAEEIARYAGEYDLRIGSRTVDFRVFGSDGRLMSSFAGQASRLRPDGDHEFVVVLNPSIRVVFTVEAGRAERVTLIQGDQSNSGNRRR